VHELPFSINQQRLQVVVRVAAFIGRRSVANFKVSNLFIGFVDQPVAIACTRPKTRAHSWRELGSPFIRVKCRSTFENIDELVLPGVRVTQRRSGIRRQAREVYAEVCQPKEIAERALFSAGHARRERLGVDGSFSSWRHFTRDDSDRV
jgi:hypothetical protein